MFDELEALEALYTHGTMYKAGRAVHITQSAVSKRIASLQLRLRKRLVERHGRRVELTPVALRLLERARPMLHDIKNLVVEEDAEASGRIVIDVSVSVLVSWAANALARAVRKIPGLELSVNAYHASISVERVRSGESMVALVQGTGRIAKDLSSLLVFNQEMVIIPSKLERFKITPRMKVPVLSMESGAEASQYIEECIEAGRKKWGFIIEPATRVQSFSAIVQLARAGFGHGLAPRGVAHSLGLTDKQLIDIPSPGISVPVSLIGRRTTLARPNVQKLYETLLKERE